VSDFRLFPNPTTGTTQITLSLVEEAPIFLQILDINGQLIFEEYYSNRKEFSQLVNLSNFANGIYLVKIGLNQQIIRRKLIKVD